MPKTPIWQPIDKLPELATFIEEHLGPFQDRLSMYRLALGKPQALGDATLRRALQAQREDLERAAVPQEQIARWSAGRLTAKQKAELKRLTGEVLRWRTLCNDIIVVLEELLLQNATQPANPVEAAAFYIEVQCRPYDSLCPLTRLQLPFHLPREVTMARRDEDDRLVYGFTHQVLGFLGQLEIKRAPGGVDLVALVNDTKGKNEERGQRRAYFTQLTDRLMAAYQGVLRQGSLGEAPLSGDQIVEAPQVEARKQKIGGLGNNGPEGRQRHGIKAPVLTDKHLDAAAAIDAKVSRLVRNGCDGRRLFVEMSDDMATFKWLLDTAREDMDELCHRFEGFYYYVKVLESIAAGIASGSLQVPHSPGREKKKSKKPPKSTPVLPTLTVNRQFMAQFISAKPPCFALGLVEERSQRRGFLALRPDKVIPREISDAGFCFGHSLMGTKDYEVVHFAFEFYGFETYSVLINPNDPVTQTVLSTMVESKDYFFFAIHADNTVTSFRSELGEENLSGLKTTLPRIRSSTTTDFQYRNAVSQFEKKPSPPGTVLHWVCRDVEYLDLTKDRLELTSASMA